MEYGRRSLAKSEGSVRRGEGRPKRAESGESPSRDTNERWNARGTGRLGVTSLLGGATIRQIRPEDRGKIAARLKTPQGNGRRDCTREEGSLKKLDDREGATGCGNGTAS